MFLPLVAVDEESGEPTRRRALLESVTADPDARLLVEALVEARLLQTGRDGSDAYLEIAHEALFRSWTRLADWIAGVRGDLHLLRELRKAARTWDEHERSRDYLWLGERGQESSGCWADYSRTWTRWSGRSLARNKSTYWTSWRTLTCTHRAPGGHRAAAARPRRPAPWRRVA